MRAVCSFQREYSECTTRCSADGVDALRTRSLLGTSRLMGPVPGLCRCLDSAGAWTLPVLGLCMCCFECEATRHEDFVRPNCSWCARRHAIRQCSDKSARSSPVFAADHHEPGAGGATAGPSKPTSVS